MSPSDEPKLDLALISIIDDLLGVLVIFFFLSGESNLSGLLVPVAPFHGVKDASFDLACEES
jgi:hypothetical protein